MDETCLRHAQKNLRTVCNNIYIDEHFTVDWLAEMMWRYIRARGGKDVWSQSEDFEDGKGAAVDVELCLPKRRRSACYTDKIDQVCSFSAHLSPYLPELTRSQLHSPNRAG